MMMVILILVPLPFPLSSRWLADTELFLMLSSFTWIGYFRWQRIVRTCNGPSHVHKCSSGTSILWADVRKAVWTALGFLQQQGPFHIISLSFFHPALVASWNLNLSHTCKAIRDVAVSDRWGASGWNGHFIMLGKAVLRHRWSHSFATWSNYCREVRFSECFVVVKRRVQYYADKYDSRLEDRG